MHQLLISTNNDPIPSEEEDFIEITETKKSAAQNEIFHTVQELRTHIREGKNICSDYALYPELIIFYDTRTIN